MASTQSVCAAQRKFELVLLRDWDAFDLQAHPKANSPRLEQSRHKHFHRAQASLELAIVSNAI